MKIPSNTHVRQEPYLTLNAVVKIMAASSAKDREALIYDFKYPDPEGKAQAYYYGIARGTIHDYHAAGNDRCVVTTKLDSLLHLYKGANAAKIAKLDNNIRVIQSYMSHFGNRKFCPEDAPQIVVEYEGVSLSMHADFLATEGKDKRIIRYAFSQRESRMMKYGTPCRRYPSTHGRQALPCDTRIASS